MPNACGKDAKPTAPKTQPTSQSNCKPRKAEVAQPPVKRCAVKNKAHTWRSSTFFTAHLFASLLFMSERLLVPWSEGARDMRLIAQSRADKYVVRIEPNRI